MAEMKTKQNDASVSAFLDSVPDPQRRKDAKAVAAMLASVTKTKPKMWGPSIVGYGTQHYKYATGREGDWFRAGFPFGRTASRSTSWADSIGIPTS